MSPELANYIGIFYGKILHSVECGVENTGDVEGTRDIANRVTEVGSSYGSLLTIALRSGFT